MPLSGPSLGPLRILLVEDSAEDAELVADQLLESGLDATFERVDTADALRRALREFAPHIVLSDVTMPGFSGYEALRVVRDACPLLPFIFVSGTMGEEIAVQALQQGANDYIIKHLPARMPSAVARAVREMRSEVERQRVEGELMRAQRLESLSLLAAGLSHDLRNILQPLLIMPGLLKARSDDPQVWHLADVIAECGRRGHEMAESMLSFVRGSQRASERVAVGKLFDAVGLLLRGSLPDDVSLQVLVEDTDLAVEANYTELQQVLLNLALNGIQAMPDGGMLWLRARRDLLDGNPAVLVSVTDEGTGMDAEVLARLFQPFFTTKREGTGLGLISCKRIVESCHGTIQVHSTPGQGTRFDLLLPLATAALDTTPALAGSGPAVGRGQSILVVDGEATRLSLLGNALSSQGYSLQLAADGAAALQWLQGGNMPTLVIADAGARLLAAGSLLAEMVEQGYRGPALVLEDADAPLHRDQFPPQLQVHMLRKPLEMQQVFTAVASALEE